jgi:ABC-type Zn uptake system ZnuABC Zn-binding protein ZnuA
MGTVTRWLGTSLVALASACAPAPPPVEAPGRPRVIVSIQPLHDLVRRIGGTDVEAVLVLRPGQEAHTFSPSPRDVARLEGAALSIGIGLGLDDWSSRAAEQVSSSGGPLRRLLLGPELEPIGHDPHVWLDPERMSRAAGPIAAALGDLVPERALDFAERAETVTLELRALDREIAGRAREWPRRALISAHPFLSYYAERYGLVLVGAVEPEPGRGLTPGSRARLLETIRERSVAAVVAQAEDHTTLARSVSEESDLPLCVLRPLGRDEDQSYETTLRELTDALETTLR